MKVLKKYALVIILCAALATSWVISIVLNNQLMEYSNSNKYITGTYFGNGNALPAEWQYLVFQSDDTYMYYKQEEVIEKGVYEIDKSKDETHIVTLRSEGDNKESQLARMGNTIFYSDRSGAMVVFDRISDVPVYMNAGADESKND